MVSNKNRKTKFYHHDFTKEASKAFESCWNKGSETKSQAMLKIVNGYKSKCLGHTDQGIITAD
jgi:hypothetical protein